MSDPLAVRSNEIYVEWITKKAFTYLLHDSDETVDSLINKVLSDWLKANHPKVLEHLKAQWEKDVDFKKAYDKPPF